MIGKLAAVVLVFSWLPDCKGAGEPGSFEKFLSRGADLGSEEMCSAANDRKQFWLEGYLQLPSSLSISSGKTSLEFYARIDGKGRGAGRPISIEVTVPGDIDDLWASATGKRLLPSARSRHRSIQTPCASAPRTDTRPPRDWIKHTFDIVALPERNIPFESRQIAGCKYQFVKAEKV